MSLLEKYTYNVTQTMGLAHQEALRTLRLYIKTTPEDELHFYIMRINKIDELKALWEAGLTAPTQKAVLERYRQLTGTEMP